MRLTGLPRLLLAIALAGAIVPAAAQDKKDKPAAQREIGAGILRLLPADSVTEHSIDTAQGKLTYTATAGTLTFFNQSGEKSAAVFYTAYVMKSAGPNRPITFAFNGGPGAASAYLNLGLVGPRLLDLSLHDAAQARLQDNPDTWLRFTDLVLIDPIGTGWSRTVKADDAKEYQGVNADANAMAKAIALYVAKNGRNGSPKYLLGESYGGFRAAKTANALKDQQGIAVSGIVMVSPLLEGWLTFDGSGSALHAALRLPSLAAAALERKKAFTPAALAAAEKFAMTDYLTTLAGPPPSGAAADAFYRRVAEVSGVPFDVVKQTRGFIGSAYIKSLRAGESKIVSNYDATIAVDDPLPEQRAAHAPDPVLDSITRAYGGAMVDYARNELGFKTEMTYNLLAPIAGKWEWNGRRQGASVEDDLRFLLAYSPSFRVLIAHGYSDMVTPYGMSRYVIDHMPVFDPPGRIALKLYRGGHMLYLDPAARKAFSADAAAFYRQE